MKSLEGIYKSWFYANSNFERGRLRNRVILASVLSLSLFRQLLFPAMLININALLASVLLLFRKKAGLHLYRLNILVASFHLVLSVALFFFTGMGGYLPQSHTFYYITELLLLVPAVSLIKKDSCIREYFTSGNIPLLR